MVIEKINTSKHDIRRLIKDLCRSCQSPRHKWKNPYEETWIKQKKVAKQHPMCLVVHRIGVMLLLKKGLEIQVHRTHNCTLDKTTRRHTRHGVGRGLQHVRRGVQHNEHIQWYTRLHISRVPRGVRNATEWGYNAPHQHLWWCTKHRTRYPKLNSWQWLIQWLVHVKHTIHVWCSYQSI
jgi:hypothetical protein